MPNRSPARETAEFIGLTFTIGWGSWIPTFLFPAIPRAITLVGLFAPAIAAIVLTWRSSGRAGIAVILRRYLVWRFGLSWYVLALLVVPAIFVSAAAIDSVAFGADFQGLRIRTSWWFPSASFTFLLVITSGEETGWRGYALTRLESLLGTPLRASVVLGLVWGLWHLPLYLVPGQSTFPFGAFLLFTVGLSITYATLYHRTRESLLAVLLLHASTDFMPRVMRIDHFSARTWWLVVVLTWITAIPWFRSPVPLHRQG